MNKVRLGDIADIITGPFGSMLHKSDYVIDGIPLIMPQDIGDRSVDFSAIARISEADAIRLKKYEVIESDIVYSRRGDVEKHAFVKKEYGRMFCGTGCLRVRVNSKLANPLFVSFYLNRPESKAWISKQAVGSNMSNINTEILSDVLIELPDICIQEKISNVLNTIDEKIKNNRKINDNLEKQMRLLFENMMVKATSHMLEGNYVVAKDIASIVTGKEDANFSVSDGKYKFFTCSNTPLLCNNYVFDSSSILIAGNGDFNVKHFSGKFNAYQRTYVLIPKKEYYALLYLASLYMINSFKASSSGSIVKFITKGDIESIPIFIPNDISYLHKFNRFIYLQEQNTLESEMLTELRDWLLPMLMNGQATIND